MVQLVEHHLAKVGVAGSSPVSRSGEGSRIAVSDSGLGLFFRAANEPRAGGSER